MSKEFMKQMLLPGLERQKEMDRGAKTAVKNFADKLADAREEDALTFFSQMRQLESEGVDTRYDKAYALMLDKLAEVGYKEAVEVARRFRHE